VSDRLPALRMLGRALLRRCPVCGGGKVFRGYFSLEDACRSCGFAFEREEGYWVGAMILNIGGAQVMFFAFFIGGMVLTWPDPPWTVFLVGGIALMAAFPIVFYPYSKLLWLWGDLAIRPPDDARERFRSRRPR
jgi:uncharacterized protein (DUF983 family)